MVAVRAAHIHEGADYGDVGLGPELHHLKRVRDVKKTKRLQQPGNGDRPPRVMRIEGSGGRSNRPNPGSTPALPQLLD